MPRSHRAILATAVAVVTTAAIATGVGATTRTPHPTRSATSVNALGFRAPTSTLYRRQVAVDTSPAAIARNDAQLGTYNTLNGGSRPGNVAAQGSPRPITRGEIIERAYSWVDAKVPYCQRRWHTNAWGTYRMDCSGYVSMAWGAREFYTGNVMRQASRIRWQDLRIGDALYYHKRGNIGHIMLFMGWADVGATSMVVWHSTSGKGTGTCPMNEGARAGGFSLRHVRAKGYIPIRYSLLQEGHASRPTVTVTATADPSEDVPGKEDLPDVEHDASGPEGEPVRAHSAAPEPTSARPFGHSFTKPATSPPPPPQSRR